MAGWPWTGVSPHDWVLQETSSLKHPPAPVHRFLREPEPARKATEKERFSKDLSHALLSFAAVGGPWMLLTLHLPGNIDADWLDFILRPRRGRLCPLSPQLPNFLRQ